MSDYMQWLMYMQLSIHVQNSMLSCDAEMRV